MYQTAPGNRIPFPDKILEKFLFDKKGYIDANISFEKLGPFVCDFYHMLPEPLFFVLQIPLSKEEENLLRQENVFHEKVFYLDGQSTNDIEAIMAEYGELLLADGMSQFAIASHKSREEIFIQKYKLTTIYAPYPERFLPLLEQYGLTEANDLFTAWQTFSHETPGECYRLTINGLTAHDVADRLIEKGMYYAETIPDP